MSGDRNTRGRKTQHTAGRAQPMSEGGGHASKGAAPPPTYNPFADNPSKEKLDGGGGKKEDDFVFRTQMKSVKADRSGKVSKMSSMGASESQMSKHHPKEEGSAGTPKRSKEEQPSSLDKDKDKGEDGSDELTLKERIVKKVTFTVVYMAFFSFFMLCFATIIMLVEYKATKRPGYCDSIHEPVASNGSGVGRPSAHDKCTSEHYEKLQDNHEDVFHAAYYCWELFTTVGYGELIPLTWQGRLVTLSIAFVMCPLYLAVKAEFGQWLTDLCFDGVTAVFKFCHDRGPWRHEKFVPPSGGVRTIIYLCMFSSHVMMCTTIVYIIDPVLGYNGFFETFYFNIITVLGIGLGDFTPSATRRGTFLLYMGILHLFGDTYLTHIMVYLQDRCRLMIKTFIERFCTCVKFPHKVETTKAPDPGEGRFFNVMKAAVPTRPEHMTQRNEHEQKQVEELERIDKLNDDLEAMFKKNAAIKEEVDKAAGEYVCQVCLKKIKKQLDDDSGRKKKKKKKKQLEDAAIDEEEEEMFPKKKVKAARTIADAAVEIQDEVTGKPAPEPPEPPALVAPVKKDPKPAVLSLKTAINPTLAAIGDQNAVNSTQGSDYTKTRRTEMLVVDRTVQEEEEPPPQAKKEPSLHVAPTVDEGEEEDGPPKPRRLMRTPKKNRLSRVRRRGDPDATKEEEDDPKVPGKSRKSPKVAAPGKVEESKKGDKKKTQLTPTQTTPKKRNTMMSMKTMKKFRSKANLMKTQEESAAPEREREQRTGGRKETPKKEKAEPSRNDKKEGQG